MTDDRAALVEKVARMFCSASEEECCNDTGIGCWYTYTATAAIDLIRAEVLEEAAGVADEKEDEWTLQWRAGLKIDSHLEGKSDGACEIAAAILALKGKP